MLGGAVALDTQRHVVSLEICENLGEDLLVRISTRAPHPDPPDAERHMGADFQDLRANRAALSSSKLGTLEADPPELAEQDVGDARKPKPELVGGENRGAITVGEQAKLRFFESVFLVPAA